MELPEPSDDDVLSRFPHRNISHDTKNLYRGWLQRKLLINRCAECAYWHHPPKPVCPRCWSMNIEPREVSGDGTVYLLVLLHQGPPAAGIDYSTPHPVAAVELDEQPGLRYTTTVINHSPGELRIGLRVQLTWIERDGAPYPAFEPASK